MDELVFNLIFITLLVLGNAYFVAVEFALVRAHLTKLKSPEYQNKFGIKASLRLAEDLDTSLSASQIGITILSLTLGWIGERTFSEIFYTAFLLLELPYSQVLAHGVATAMALAVVTFLHVVIGELCAKSIGIRYPETVLRYCAPLLLIFTKTCGWLVYLLRNCANLILSIFGLRTVPESERVHSPQELSMLIEQSTEFGVLDKNEEEMLKGIFGFSETVAREIMTPRPDLVTIPLNSTLDEIAAIITKSGFSRFPVTGEKVDDVVGILMARDLIPVIQKLRNNHDAKFELRPHLREAYFIPGTKPIDDLLNEFKTRKVHLAIVLDEHGGVDGAVSLEDIIEEIVGDIFDESDKAESDITVGEDGDILLDGGLLVADVNEKFNLKIPEGDYDTIGGFIFSALGRMSQEGDEIHLRDDEVYAVNGVVLKENGNGGGGNGGGNYRDNNSVSNFGNGAVGEDGEVREGDEGSVLIDKEKEKDFKNDKDIKYIQAFLKVESLAGNRIETVRVHIGEDGDGEVRVGE